jgi:hypothetical protein
MQRSLGLSHVISSIRVDVSSFRGSRSRTMSVVIGESSESIAPLTPQQSQIFSSNRMNQSHSPQTASTTDRPSPKHCIAHISQSSLLKMMPSTVCLCPDYLRAHPLVPHDAQQKAVSIGVLHDFRDALSRRCSHKIFQ